MQFCISQEAQSSSFTLLTWRFVQFGGVQHMSMAAQNNEVISTSKKCVKGRTVKYVEHCGRSRSEV